MPSDTFEFYVREASKVKTIRQDTLDEVINLIESTSKDYFGNIILNEGFQCAKEKFVRDIKKLKNGK